MPRPSPPSICFALLWTACLGWTAGVGWTAGGGAEPATASEPLLPPTEVGVGGFVRPGAWAPLTFDGKGTITVRVTDGDGLTLERTPTLTGGAALFQAGRAESSVEVVHEGIAPIALRPGEDFTVLAPDERLWAAVGLPPALRRLNERGEVDPNAPGPVDRPGAPVRIAAFAGGEDLPAVPHGLGTVRTLLIEASALPADDAFLRDWVAGGGHLILSLDAAGELPAWVPLAAGDPVSLTARSALERLAKAGSGRGTAAVINKLAPAAARPLDAADVRAADGRVLAVGDGGALVAEVPLGFGRVTAVAVSLHASPMSGWAGLPAFLLELTRAAPGGGLGDAPPAGEIAGQVYGALEADAVGGLSPGAVGVWVLALLALIGPLDLPAGPSPAGPAGADLAHAADLAGRRRGVGLGGGGDRGTRRPGGWRSWTWTPPPAGSAAPPGRRSPPPPPAGWT